VPWQTIAHYEQGWDFNKNNRGRHPLLHCFQAICAGYGLDLFQVCELLRLLPVAPGPAPGISAGLPGRGSDALAGALGSYEGLQPARCHPTR